MLARLSFGLIAGFWLTMSALLWRSEFGARDPEGDVVPVPVVWRKILTSPDSSSLSIWQHGKRLGFCHWISGVSEELGNLEEAPPEGFVEKTKQSLIKMDGNLTLPEHDLRLRFEMSLKLDAHQAWQEFNVRLSTRPTVMEIKSVAAEQSVTFLLNDGETTTRRVIRFADLQHPETIIRELGSSSAWGLLAALGLPAMTSSSLTAGMQWEARSETRAFGHEPIQVYRLQTRLLGRYKITVFVSRAGELLRVELPNDIIFNHDQLNVVEPKQR